MIAILRGQLQEKEASRAVVMVGGIGIACRISLKTYEKLPEKGASIELHTLMQLTSSGNVGPLTPVLFGFSTPFERKVFELLISVSRLGASTALATLSYLEAEEVLESISAGDIKKLTTVKGIGNKAAERIVLELKDKAAGLSGISSSSSGASSTSGVQQEALDALEALGFQRSSAEKQIKTIIASQQGDITVEELVRQVLVQS